MVWMQVLLLQFPSVQRLIGFTVKATMAPGFCPDDVRPYVEA